MSTDFLRNIILICFCFSLIGLIISFVLGQFKYLAVGSSPLIMIFGIYIVYLLVEFADFALPAFGAFLLSAVVWIYTSIIYIAIGLIIIAFLAGFRYFKSSR